MLVVTDCSGMLKVMVHFSLALQIKSLVFTISQKGNEALMRAIEKFLYNLVPLNFKNEKGYDSWVKINSDNRGMFNLVVQRGAYRESVLIPLFDSLSWYSKKYLDYSDWKAIFISIKKGLIILQKEKHWLLVYLKKIRE